MAKACQLFSGSSGNSILISHRETKILVDAGVSAKRIENALSQIGENAGELDAIFITHEHSDHIAGVRVLASRHNIPVFADPLVIAKMSSLGAVNDKIHTENICNNMEIGGVEVVPFENSHDSVACLGYRFNMGGKSISVCTDTGYITDEAKKTLMGTDMIFLESNHEVSMLMNGTYPYYLKQRILSSHGHLSNETAGEFAKELVQSGTTRLVLSHLSRENNQPDIARQTTVSSMQSLGLKLDEDYLLSVSKPENQERAMIL